jgi:hypothetical protein
VARISAKDADFVFNAVAIEDELNSVTLNFAVPEAEITAFADAGQNFLAGKLGTSLEIAGSVDLAASQGDATIFAALGGAALTWDFEPDGATGYNGYAFPTAYSIVAAVGAPVTYTATLRHNGISAAADGGIPVRG